jgi:hypothetical protein
MLRRTEDCLSRGVENICEASFSWDGNYCAVDILHRQGDGYAIYEVKSSSNSYSDPLKDKDLMHLRGILRTRNMCLHNAGLR